MCFEGQLLVHLWKRKSFSLVDLGLLKVHVVECMLTLIVLNHGTTKIIVVN